MSCPGASLAQFDTVSVQDHVLIDCHLAHGAAVPVGNLIRWQVKPNRAMFLSYERSLQPDLVGVGIIVPIAGLVGSRDPDPSTSD